MFQIERQEKILQYINESKKANTEQLADIFQVSKVTIRRDIDALAEKGLILKTHGGAVSLNGTLLHEIPYSSKATSNMAAKKAIGLAAASLIEDGDIIILDSGSTTLEIAKNIRQSDVTILTNDLKIAMELTHKNNIQVMVCGGNLNLSVYTLTGNMSINFFERLHVNKTFLSCDAMDIKFGISNRTYEEADIKTAMIHAADEVIMVADKSKLNKRVFCKLCDFSDINKLIIDSLDIEDRTVLTEIGVEVMVTDELKSNMHNSKKQ